MKPVKVVTVLVTALVLAFAHTTMARAGGSSGSFYVVDNLGNTFHQYDITSGGGLSAKSPASGATSNTPTGIAATPDGTHLYISSNTTITEYSVGGNGALTSIGTIGLGGGGAWQLVITPDGRSLYASGIIDNDVAEFSIQSDGTLVSLGTTGSGSTGGPTGLVISPNGRFLYVTDDGSDAVTVFAIQNNGSLSSGVTDSDPALNGPFDMVINPAGTGAYVVNSLNNTVVFFSVNATNGTLGPGVVTGSGFDLPVQAIENPSGTNLYVANTNNNTVSNCHIGITGLLSLCAVTPVGSQPQGLALSPDETSLYVSNGGDDTVSMFTISSGGALAAQTPATVATGVSPVYMVALPDQAPHAAFVPATPAGSLTASFNATTSSAPGGTVAQYDWNFGDGITAINGGATLSHQYAAAGTYTVTLTVTDNNGCSTTQVFTGKTVLCNGTSAAQVAQTVTVPSGVPVPNTGSASPINPEGPMLVIAGVAMLIARRRRAH